MITDTDHQTKLIKALQSITILNISKNITSDEEILFIRSLHEPLNLIKFRRNESHKTRGNPKVRKMVGTRWKKISGGCQISSGRQKKRIAGGRQVKSG